jgi:hypothetical protein
VETPHLHYYLMWSVALIQTHESLLSLNHAFFRPSLQTLMKSINAHRLELSKICNENQYVMEFLDTVFTREASEGDSKGKDLPLGE